MQGKDVLGQWETGEAKLIAKIRIYRIVLERPADPPGKQDTAEQFFWSCFLFPFKNLS